MSDDKREGQEKKGDNSTFKEVRSSAVVAIAVAFVVAVVLFPLHIIRMDIITMFGSASWIVASLIFGLIVGLIYYLAPSNSKSTWAIITFVVIIIILGVTGGLQLGFLQGPADSAGKFFQSSWNGIRTSFACFNPNSAECLANAGGGNDNTSQDSSDTATVTFTRNEIKGGQISTLVKISYNNKESTPVRVTPRCFAGEKEEDMQQISVQNMNPPKEGEDFLFPVSNKPTTTSLKCLGSVPECKVVSPCNQNLFFTLTRDIKITGDSWKIDLNEASLPALNVIQGQPYHTEISYDGGTTMLTSGTTIYLQVKIIGTETKEKLKKINYVTLKFPEQISMECPNSPFSSIPGGIELRNIDPVQLEQNQFKTGDNEYSFDCSLTVETETTTIQQIIISINSGYNVEALFGPYLLKEYAGSSGSSNAG